MYIQIENILQNTSLEVLIQKYIFCTCMKSFVHFVQTYIYRSIWNTWNNFLELWALDLKPLQNRVW